MRIGTRHALVPMRGLTPHAFVCDNQRLFFSSFRVRPGLWACWLLPGLDRAEMIGWEFTGLAI